jgi:hypothetical protein
MRNILTLVASLAFASAVTACGSSGEFCDAKCDCEGCSEREYDECVILEDAREEEASIYGCSDLYGLLHECRMLNNNCNGIGSIDIFTYESECVDDDAELAECIRDNSAIR